MKKYIVELLDNMKEDQGAYWWIYMNSTGVRVSAVLFKGYVSYEDMKRRHSAHLSTFALAKVGEKSTENTQVSTIETKRN